jgi:hypothetical protein
MVIAVSKVVGALPIPLVGDMIYVLRTGAGFDLYATDTTGTTAHGLNQTVGGVGSQQVFVQQTRPAGLGPWMWWRKNASGAIFDLVVTDGVA